MGEAKVRQYNREQFMLRHPYCAYCGEPATTTDHCPPRCFFERRNWPETYEFPSCAACNQESRRDEQALAIIARNRLRDDDTERGQVEWNRLFKAIVNNQPEIVAEWRNTTPTRQKRFFRDVFGQHGDAMRWAGYGAINLGPVTRAAIERFGVKLGKALYYRHIEQIFEGDIYVRQIDPFIRTRNPEYLEKIFQFAPEFATLQRNAKPLMDQFSYRFNHSSEVGVVYAIAQFGDQFLLQIMAVREDTAHGLEAAGKTMPMGVYRCNLKRRGDPQVLGPPASAERIEL